MTAVETLEQRVAELERIILAMPGVARVLAREVKGDGSSLADRHMRSVDAIVADAAELFRITRTDILGLDRRHSVARARAAICWVARQTTTLSLATIAERLGGMHHTSVMSAVERAEELRSSEQPFLRVTNDMWQRATARS